MRDRLLERTPPRQLTEQVCVALPPETSSGSTFRLQNPSGEELDVLVEGNDKSDAVAIFVHGSDTDKNGPFNLFPDIALALRNNFLTICFDFSGCGLSQGRHRDASLDKRALDLETIINWAKMRHPQQEICLVAHCLGILVVSHLSPQFVSKVSKAILISIPSTDSPGNIEMFKALLKMRGGTINTDGISTYQGTNGYSVEIGSQFWRDVSRNPAEMVKELAQKVPLTIFHPENDELFYDDDQDFAAYKQIPNAYYRKIPGSHNFTNPSDRAGLISLITKIFPSPAFLINNLNNQDISPTKAPDCLDISQSSCALEDLVLHS